MGGKREVGQQRWLSGDSHINAVNTPSSQLDEKR